MSVKTVEELNRRAPGRVILSVPFEGDGIGAPGRVILQDGYSARRFVVHWQNRQDGGCMDGGYHVDLAKALFDLAKRVTIEEGYVRGRGDLLELEIMEPVSNGPDGLEGFMASARFYLDLSKNGNDSLNLDDASGVPGVIWDDWLWASLDPSTLAGVDAWQFEDFQGPATIGTYEEVSEAAYGYYLENR